ncbi:MAG: hypothetical protein EBQ85_00030 [Proteobacteria bacterium]|nr:hypothetical protein [Pseudomonadota bacterium]
MATVRLDNLVKPRQANSPTVKISQETKDNAVTYTDIKLDLELSKNIGLGLSPILAKDIVVSEDMQAIRNSLYNIFSTKKGEMILTPNFGSSLDQFLFENVSPFIGKVIGENILSALQTFEPRIEVLNVRVFPKPNDNQYSIEIIFKFVNINKESSLNILLSKNGQIIL